MKTKEIADFLSAELVGSGDVDINGVASLETAGPGDLAFVDGRPTGVTSAASCLVVPEDFAYGFFPFKIRIDANVGIEERGHASLPFTRIEGEVAANGKKPLGNVPVDLGWVLPA